MSEEINKSIVRRIWEEAWNEGNLATIDELVAADYVLHAYPEDLGFGSGAEGLKRLISTWRTNFPESRGIIKALIAEDDKVVTHYTAQVTSAAMTTGIWIDRVLDNKVMESWVDWDRLGLFQQLGIIPKLGQTDS
jgi:predicted SnoaL-like aldol condensation-catalyzing enzyme